MRVVVMKSIATSLAAAIALFLVLTATSSRTTSQSLTGSILLERRERNLDASGQLLLIDHIREVIRPDGSRALTKLRTFRNPKSPTGWETHESKLNYDAKKNVTEESYPALGLFGSLPIGNQKFRPLSKMATCRGLLPEGTQIIEGPKTVKFGYSVESYTLEVVIPDSDKKWILHVEGFPSLGCLVGNKTTEVRKKSDSSLVARKIIEVLAISTVPDDPSEFVDASRTLKRAKPSEILKKDADVMGKECPQCLIDAGNMFDARHDKLWSERAEGKR